MRIRLLYHYTYGAIMPSILARKRLIPSSVGLVEGERGAVWFTRSPIWEATAIKKFVDSEGREAVLTPEEIDEHVGGRVRIVVPASAAPYSWDDYRALSGIPEGHWVAMAKIALERGSDPRDWFVSFDPVPLQLALDIQIFRSGRWVSI